MKCKILHAASVMIIFTICHPLIAQKSIEYDPSHQYAYMRNGNIESNNIDFIYYEYETTTLNLTHFELSFPQLAFNVPSYLEIVPPRKNMENFAYAVGYITKDGNIDKGALVIMLIDNYDKQPIFYIDKNMDYDFTNDSEPIVFRKSSKKQIWINLHHHDIKKKKYDFYLVNPVYQEKLKPKEFDPTNDEIQRRTQSYIAENQKQEPQNSLPERKLKNTSNFFRNGFFAELAIYTGAAQINYYHETSVDVYPITNYLVHYNPRGIELGLGYAFHNFQLNFNGSTENIYYQTSTLRTTSVYFSPVINRYRRTGEIYSNIDNHPTTKYSYDFSLGYNIKLSHLIFLMPYAHYGQYSFKNNYYSPNFVNDPNERYELTNRRKFGFGGKFSILTHNKGAFIVNVKYSNLTFEPKGYFESKESIVNLKSQNVQISFGIGYQLRLFNFHK
jgi:hypothetical protein